MSTESSVVELPDAPAQEVPPPVLSAADQLRRVADWIEVTKYGGKINIVVPNDSGVPRVHFCWGFDPGGLFSGRIAKTRRCRDSQEYAVTLDGIEFKWDEYLGSDNRVQEWREVTL